MGSFSTFDYIAGADARQRLDIVRPTAAVDLHTAVLVLHGGAFLHGDRAVVHPRCQALAARGITAIAVGYRLLDTAPWPAQLDDVRAALRWTYRHAGEFAVDTGRIVLQGHSAGAQLALLGADTLANDSTPVASGVIAYYPPAAMSLAPSAGDMPAQMLLGPDATAEAAAGASPLTHIDARFPPTALVHGAADRFVSPVASLRLFEALAVAGVRSELHIFAGQDHEFDMTPRYGDATTDLAVAFLRAEVAERELVAKEIIDANPFASMPAPGADPA
nr:alpha/beta hydrolase [Mycobacterium sp. 1465703.0]